MQITGCAQIPLAEAEFILDPKSIVPVAVDLFRPERAGLGKFVGGGVAGVAGVGKSVGKAGLSGVLSWKLCLLAVGQCPLAAAAL